MKKYFAGNLDTKKNLDLYEKATKLMEHLIDIDQASTENDRSACTKYLAYVLQSFYDDGYYDGLETVSKML